MTGEKVLLQRAKKGEMAAFESLVTAYERRVYSLALRSTGSEADAADITQEVFLRAYRSLDTFRGESGFSTWLYRITVNLCVDLARKNNPAESLDDEPRRLKRPKRAAPISRKPRSPTANCVGSWTRRSVWCPRNTGKSSSCATWRA